MAVSLDHTIVGVHDRAESVAFYTRIFGLSQDADQGPFSTLRVNDSFVLLFAEPRHASGHYAFAMDSDEFDAVFARVRDAGIPYGDSFHNVGSMTGPGQEPGARGMAQTVYFNDPSGHLLEIRRYA